MWTRHLSPQEAPGSRQVGAAFHEVLAEVDGAERARVLQDVLVLVTTQLGYCARARTLLRRLAHDMEVGHAGLQCVRQRALQSTTSTAPGSHPL